MAYELIQEEGNKKTVRFTMEADDLARVFKSIKRKISKEASIPGFRSGHVPDSILDKRFGNLIIAEVAEKAHKQLTEGLFDEFDWVLSDEDPEFENLLPVEGDDYSYTVTYKLFETPKPVDYSGIKLAVPVYDIDKAVEETIENIRVQFVSFDETDQPSAVNDLVVLTYTPAEEGGKPEPRELSAVIGQNDMGPGFDEIITGVKAGDVFSMQMKISKQGEEELAGPSHAFTVKQVKAHSYPALDNEFAAKAGGFESMDDFREKIREDIADKFKKEVRGYTESLAVDTILESNKFDVPQFMVNNLKEEYLSRLEDEDTDEASVKAMKEMAEKKVREFLLLRQIAIVEEIEVSEDEIEEAVNSGDTRAAFLDRTRNQRALDFVISRAIIEDRVPEEPKDVSGDTNTVPWSWVPVDGEPAGSEGAE